MTDLPRRLAPTLGLLVAAALACGGSPASEKRRPGPIAATTQATSSQVPVDVPGPAPAPACFGRKVPMILSSNMPYSEVAVDGRPGWFVLDTGTTRSGFSRGFYEVEADLGTRVRRGRLDFVIPWENVDLRVDDYSHIPGTVKQVGMIGTDLLVRHPRVFDYETGAFYSQIEGPFCDEATLVGRGLVPVALHDDKTTTYDDEVGARLNIPTIDIEIGSVRAKAQLDTGLDDGWPNRPTRLSLNVNAPLVKALHEAGLTTKRFGDPVHLTTCVHGELDVVWAISLPPRTPVSVVGADGTRYPFSDVTLYEKEGTGTCGGITAMKVPAIQMGASWFDAWGTFALDPDTHRLWIRPVALDPAAPPG